MVVTFPVETNSGFIKVFGVERMLLPIFCLCKLIVVFSHCTSSERVSQPVSDPVTNLPAHSVAQM